METKIKVNSIKLSQKYIDAELALQANLFNKSMLRKLSERALSRAYQLDKSGA